MLVEQLGLWPEYDSIAWPPESLPEEKATIMPYIRSPNQLPLWPVRWVDRIKRRQRRRQPEDWLMMQWDAEATMESRRSADDE